MPRDTSGTYAKPAGTTAINGATISSTSFNTLIDDMIADLNAGSPLARIPYDNRAAAIAADVEAGLSEIEVMTPDGKVLRYTRDASGDALTTNSGSVSWSPSGFATPFHWAENTTPGTTDMETAFQAFVDYVTASTANVPGFLWGDIYSAGDITGMHDIEIEGPGKLKVDDGDWWRFNSNEKNSGFGGLGYNTLYVSPAGTATASGLAEAFPVTGTQAVDILGALSAPLQGLYRIILAEGVYTDALNFLNIGTSRGKPLYINGPSVDTWSKAAAPDKPQSITSLTSANPPVLTATAHGYSNGEKVFIGFAEDSGGAHDGDGAIYTVANATANTFELSGVDGSAWGAYTGSGILFSVNGSAPKSIFYGTGDGSGNGLAFDGNDVIFLQDVAGIGWGSKSGSGDEAFIRASTTKQVRMTNVHALYCSQGLTVRDQTNGLWFSGWAYECDTAFFAIHARFTCGTANPTSIPDDTPIIENSTYGVYVWEMASGHADGLTFIDCSTDAFIHRNSHCILIWNQITNTGAAKNSIIVEDSSYVLDQNNSFTGSFATRVFRRGNSTRGQQDITYTWATRAKGGVTAPTPGGSEATLSTISVPRGEMAASPQTIRVIVHFGGTWSNGDVTIRLKLGATTLYTNTLSTNASSREGSVVYELEQNGFDTVRIFRQEVENISGTTTTELDHATAAFDTSAADQDFTVTGQVANASDSLTFINVTVETLGW